MQTAPDLLISTTHCGPPASAHGGVAVGLFAQLVDSADVEVRLLAPPPLEVQLTSRTDDDGTVWVSGPEGDLARVRPAGGPISLAPFRRVPDEQVEAAAEDYLARVAEEGHAFPTCFGCGPDRHDPGALRQFTGMASDGATVTRFHVDGDQPLPSWLTLAGLDCPSGHTAGILSEQQPEAIVLGSMQCSLHRPASAGVDYQVRGRLRSEDGRKLTSEVAMLDPGGSLVASARATWIVVDAAAFSAGSGDHDR
jgi:hypothetical protein